MTQVQNVEITFRNGLLKIKQFSNQQRSLAHEGRPCSNEKQNRLHVNDYLSHLTCVFELHLEFHSFVIYCTIHHPRALTLQTFYEPNPLFEHLSQITQKK